MKLAKRNRKLFDDWIRNFFKEERRATSKEIWEKLQQDQPRLGKAIKRAGARVGASAYIGRYLLRPITKEGWLHVLNGEWMVQATPERCYHCFSAIDDIYVIDAEENRYCSLDCLEECPEARDPLEGSEKTTDLKDWKTTINIVKNVMRCWIFKYKGAGCQAQKN